jgi:uncharacterized protein YdeI (YjbR/CyaY-like superfamily)
MANRELRDKTGRLKRKLNEMPADVKLALETAGVRADYDARPAYQRNDYLSWILRTKMPEIRKKRLEQMLKELELGGVYMRMDHPASRK